MSIPIRRGDELHKAMIQFLPETDCEYARYPMNYERWLDPGETGPKGEPCFIASPNDDGIKKGYVYGPGNKGKGYYHMLTRSAQTALYSQITHKQPSVSCCCAGGDKDPDAYDKWDDVQRVMYARYKSNVPNDGRANEAAMAEAQGMANAAHHGTQGMQAGAMAGSMLG
uniref:Uncharacterized protein n=1 Tax=Craspedostauros australis TaxID=1486917 RepID=A0A7R9ZJK6_9STRA|mmetsp:Transcript_1374/g.3830  ORF Transcript_1374/g.3830 Transcript_1374/m.3830 type:complete len:169 (+) Transcript_1374:311-817(+)